MIPWALPCAQIGLTGSIYFTLAISVERYFTVCRPFYRASHAWPAKAYIVPIVLVSVVYNLPR